MFRMTSLDIILLAAANGFLLNHEQIQSDSLSWVSQANESIKQCMAAFVGPKEGLNCNLM